MRAEDSSAKMRRYAMRDNIDVRRRTLRRAARKARSPRRLAIVQQSERASARATRVVRRRRVLKRALRLDAA